MKVCVNEYGNAHCAECGSFQGGVQAEHQIVKDQRLHAHYGNGFDVADPLRRRWPLAVDPMMQKVIAKHPEALRHDPCPCGVTVAVVPRRMVNPSLHRVIDDPDLRDEVVRFIRDKWLPNSQYVGDDAVLILAEVA